MQVIKRIAARKPFPEGDEKKWRQFVNYQIRLIANAHYQDIENWLKQTLEQFAQPKIKGKMTRGKLRWRGIRFNEQNTCNHKRKYWLTQRNKQIGETLIIDMLPKLV